MSKPKRINPNRRPLSHRDLKREVDKRIEIILMVALYSLCECGAESKLINQFGDKFKLTLDCLASGIIKKEELQQVINLEYACILEKLDKDMHWEVLEDG